MLKTSFLGGLTTPENSALPILAYIARTTLPTHDPLASAGLNIVFFWFRRHLFHKKKISGYFHCLGNFALIEYGE